MKETTRITVYPFWDEHDPSWNTEANPCGTLATLIIDMRLRACCRHIS